ncbi:MAG TPA: DoxX-like family protein, partial [Burkholderiaceae bacterium]
PAALALWGGVAADLGIGLWLWLRPSRAAVDAALAATAVLTIVATVLLPGLWLHPLGPLLKNLPIVAALVVLRRSLW